MRYTLRLLTAQQFQRASSLICAMENIRKEIGGLGESRISIGLWVGDGLAPNRRADAIRMYRKMNSGESKEYPFLLSKCPWCGAQIGMVYGNNESKLVGLKDYRRPSTVRFLCGDKNCFYSKTNNYLPLTIIDEDIYDNPPDLIIGTVDKFATLVWKPDQTAKLFGENDGESNLPPQLIIQDELHLISGALGTTVGIYESLIQELCLNKKSGVIIKPKIIASTATISKASEQSNGLYARGKKNVKVFPPMALDAGDSFFAEQDNSAPGRLYVGIHAPGYSHATAHIRVTSTLLQGVKSLQGSEKDKNYYWTLLDYFNSLRELGHAVTRVEGDVKEYMEGELFMRLGLFSPELRDQRRFINYYDELTSRKDASEISRILSRLEVDYPGEDVKPLDICFATNMISVGVDVSRLGLMSVAGQPKTTSEYIQATSRVGRTKEGPGMVVIIYNPLKPRDRSHYENFNSYHSKIYSHVEATSVTPFSVAATDRLLPAILIGLIRHLGNKEVMESPQPAPSDDLFKTAKKVILDRVKTIDENEFSYVESQLNNLIQFWKDHIPPQYSNYRDPWNNTLFYDSNLVPPSEEISKGLWPVPRSMRNVNAECLGQIVSS